MALGGVFRNLCAIMLVKAISRSVDSLDFGGLIEAQSKFGMYPALEIWIEPSELSIEKGRYDECLLRQMAKPCGRWLQKPSLAFFSRMSAAFFPFALFRADDFDAADITMVGLGLVG